MKKINKFEKQVPIFTDDQVVRQVQKQTNFLHLVHPALMDFNSYNEGAVEIRPIKRLKTAKYVRSYVTWHLQDKDIESLIKMMGMLNGEEYCVYFSGFAFDHDKVTYDEKGKERKKGRINNDNALYTSILPMDFDGLTYEEFQLEKQRLIDLGIETLDIFTGHGFQSFIMLSHKVLDIDIYKKFTELMLDKGFKVDGALVDPARLLRMPYTFNCKAFDRRSKYYHETHPEIITTTDIAYTNKRYHVVDVFKAIQSLPDVIGTTSTLTTVDVEGIPTATLTVLDSKKAEKVRKEKSQIEIKQAATVRLEDGQAMYQGFLAFERLPESIQKMLMGTEDGLRNSVMLFLVPFMRNSLGLNIQTIKQVMVIWGANCSPILDKTHIEQEVERLYKYGLKAKYGRYTIDLAKAYGYLDFDQYKRDHKVILPNEIFEDVGVISDCGFKIYLYLKLSHKRDGLNEWTINDIVKIAKISLNTFHRNINYLLSLGYICKRRANRRLGEQYVYYLNPYFSSTKGYITLENATIELMLMKLTDGESKLYAYLCYMIGTAGTTCWASQKYLAKAIGKKGHNAISQMTDQLHLKNFIRKETTSNGFVMHSTYTLIY